MNAARITDQLESIVSNLEDALDHRETWFRERYLHHYRYASMHMIERGRLRPEAEPDMWADAYTIADKAYQQLASSINMGSNDPMSRVDRQAQAKATYDLADDLREIAQTGVSSRAKIRPRLPDGP